MNNRPNILVVCTDQQRTDTLSCYGARHVSTPGFDRIAQEGTCFTRAYAPSAVCTPSRVSLLSGQYPGRHNVWNIGVNTGEDVRMIQHSLSEVGYHTGLIGKAHLEAYLASKEESWESLDGFERGYDDWNGPYYGFDDVQLALGHVNYGMTGHYGAWLRERFGDTQVEAFKTLKPRGNTTSFGGEGYDWDLPLDAHNSVWTCERTVEFLEGYKKEDPFFLFVSFQDPHHPHALPDGYENPVARDKIPKPIFTEGELADRPPHFELARQGQLEGSRFLGPRWSMAGQGQGADFRNVGTEAAIDGKMQYYGMVSLIDAQLQRIWKTLEQTGQLENTLIIVTSDHGELLGDHGLWMKGPFHYEQVIRVPLLVRIPASMQQERRPAWHDPVSLVDLLPTCFDAAGLDIPGDIDGVSLFTPDHGRSVLVETVQDWEGINCLSVVSRQHKLTCYPGESFGELTDLEADPAERENLFERCSDLKAEALQRLFSIHYPLSQSPKQKISYA